MSQKKYITPDELSEMTKEEIKDLILIDSYLNIAPSSIYAIKCDCEITCIGKRWQGQLPLKMTEQDIDSLNPEEFKNLETIISRVCPCQKPYSFELTVKDGKFHLSRTKSEVWDSKGRNTQLPNVRD